VYGYTPPVGIPKPPFGTEEVAPSWPAGWPGAEVPGYYYVDSTHPNATDSGNTYGYPARPRATIAEITYAAGSYVEIHGGPYTGGGQITFGANGTAADPVWFRGASAITKPILRAETLPKGSYVIIENLYFDTTSQTLDIRPVGGSNLHHAVVRNCEFAGPGTADGSSSVIGINGGAGNRFSDIVIFNNRIHDFGDNNATAENDYHGVKPSNYVDRVWILNNTIYNMGGDSVQVGSATLTAEERPTFIYIGGNVFYGNYENAVDVKQATDVIISQNTMFNTRNPLLVLHYNPERIWTLYNTFHTSAAGFISTESTETYVVGNVFYNLHGSTVDAGNSAIRARGSTTLYVVNNTITDVDNGIYIEAGSNHVVASNNVISGVHSSLYHVFVEGTSAADGSDLHHTLFWQPDGRARIRWGSSGALTLSEFRSDNSGEGTGSLEADPRFINPTAKDFGLLSNSPAIDAGTTDSVYTVFFNTYRVSIERDAAGKSRPVGSAWDMGSYEGQGTGGGAVPASPRNLRLM
jgi:hypothetical protein